MGVMPFLSFALSIASMSFLAGWSASRVILPEPEAPPSRLGAPQMSDTARREEPPIELEPLRREELSIELKPTNNDYRDEGDDRTQWKACQGRDTIDYKFDKTFEWTIVMSTSHANSDFFLNWWQYYQKLEIDANLFVLTEDDQVYELLQNKKNLSNERIAVIDSENFRTHPLQLLSLACSPILQAKNLILAHVDTVWQKDPIPHVQTHLYGDLELDLVGQVDNTTTKEYSGGFLAMKVNSPIVRMLSEWDDKLSQPGGLEEEPARLLPNGRLPESADQATLREVLQSDDDRTTVCHEGLPTALFPSATDFFDEEKTDQYTRDLAVVVHNNWNNHGHDKKKKRFQKFGLWSHYSRSVLKNKAKAAPKQEEAPKTFLEMVETNVSLTKAAMEDLVLSAATDT